MRGPNYWGNLETLSKETYRVKPEVSYSSDHCEYKATHKFSLNTYVESNHEKVCYSCDHCDYKATENSKLKRQVEVKHEEVIKQESAT